MRQTCLTPVKGCSKNLSHFMSNKFMPYGPLGLKNDFTYILLSGLI